MQGCSVTCPAPAWRCRISPHLLSERLPGRRQRAGRPEPAGRGCAVPWPETRPQGSAQAMAAPMSAKFTPQARLSRLRGLVVDPAGREVCERCCVASWAADKPFTVIGARLRGLGTQDARAPLQTTHLAEAYLRPPGRKRAKSTRSGRKTKVARVPAQRVTTAGWSSQGGGGLGAPADCQPTSNATGSALPPASREV